MKKIHKIIFVFLAVIIISMALLLVQYNAVEWVISVIGISALVLAPLLIWRNHSRVVRSNPTPGAVFEGAVLWYKSTGLSFEKRGRFLYRDDNLQLLSKDNVVVFSVSLDEAIVYAFFNLGRYKNKVRLSVEFGTSRYIIELIPPSYKETVMEWDNAVYSNTGKHLISSGPWPKNN